MLSTAQVALFAALSAYLVNAFSPEFTNPRQCESLRITWSESSIDLPVVDMPLSEVFMSLIPLDNDPSRIAPEPYTLSVPSGGHEIAALPFPAGTQFFATADILLGAAGHVRRTISKVFTVEHSANSDCLPATAVRADGRAKVKSFGKRQISVVGPSLVESTGVPPVNAIASPSASGPPPAINVIGVTNVPAGGSSSTDQASATTTSSSSAPSATGATPPIRVIGTSNIPATGVPNVPGNVAPGNVAPVPSASGSVPPIEVVGTSYVTATGGVAPEASSSGESSSGEAYYPTGTYADTTSADATSTSCTETSTEMPMETVTSTIHPVKTVHVTSTIVVSAGDEEPCTDSESMDTSVHQTMHETTMPSETRTALPQATQSYDTAVVEYTVYDDMVNAANSMFKAWNPYKPAYTPRTGI